MNQNLWLDEQAMAILLEARDKLQALGAVCELTPASVPGEGVVAALFVSAVPRGLQASLAAHDIGVEHAASEDRSVLNAQIDHRLRTREAEDSLTQSPRVR